MTTSYPLNWPEGKPRTRHPQVARFLTRFADAYEGTLHELGRFNASNIVVSSNIRFGPRGGGKIDDPDRGVAVHFTLDGQPGCIAIDAWTSVDDNMQAIHKCVAAIRGLERWGFGLVQTTAALTAAAALPASVIAAPPPVPERGPITDDRWWVVLGVEPAADPGTIDAAYRRLAKVRHPDHGGNNAAFIQLQGAYDQGVRAHR